MPGKLNVYSLGTEGVNRVKSPVHVPDGALLIAQNAEISPDKGQRGLRKRGGLAKLTSGGAAAGSILSMSSIPLADPYGSIYVYDAALTRFRVSDDGLTWATRAAAFTPTLMINYRNRLWYITGTGLFSFDGEVEVNHGNDSAFINTPFRLAVDTTNGAIVVYGQNAAFLNLAGYRYTIDTDTWEGLIPPAGPSASPGLTVLDGTVYGGASTTQTIWRWTGSAWTTEVTFAAANQAMEMTQFGGKIYAACMPIGADPNTDKILRRDSAGVWTNVLDSAGQFRHVCKAGSRIYAHRIQTATANELWSSDTGDAGSWAVEFDLTTLGFGTGTAIRGLFEWNDTLFIVHPTLGTYRRSGAGSVQQVDGFNGASYFAWL